MNCISYMLLLFLIGLSFVGCGFDPSTALRAGKLTKSRQNFALQPGDLLFQDLDCGPLCDAIESVTTGYQEANLSHVGIVAEDAGGNLVVIEAVSNGVKDTPLQTFLERSFDANRRPKVIVGRLGQRYRHLIPSALKEAHALKARPYDKVFTINNGAYYCSELIYEIFLRANNNNPVFTLQPMTFKAPDTGENLGTWKKYFDKLGVPVPEGQLGINPGGISRSPVLTIVHQYGIPAKSL